SLTNSTFVKGALVGGADGLGKLAAGGFGLLVATPEPAKAGAPSAPAAVGGLGLFVTTAAGGLAGLGLLRACAIALVAGSGRGGLSSSWSSRSVALIASRLGGGGLRAAYSRYLSIAKGRSLREVWETIARLRRAGR